ncbi:DUF2812 domain-containing protein [Clostridium nigeriense]|uniref:DUF2812 domain-containing protein n=1 Tax=Clostridium nigeriense TaxID=1805470 RepID=UPI003D358968
MIFRDERRVIFNFLPYEYKSLQEYLEKMAIKGWMLEDINGYYLKFIKSSPKNLKYSVDIMDSISFFDGKDTDKALEYREYCKEAGWNFVCESDKRQIYCSESDENRVDIHTDEIEKFNTITKASLKYVCLSLINLICLLFIQYNITIGSGNGQFLANSFNLASLIFVNIFSLHEIVGIITFLIFFIKGKISINERRKINYNFKKVVLLKRIICYLMYIIIVTEFILLAIAYDISILKVIITIVFLVAIANCIIKFIKNKNYKNDYIIISGVYLAVTLIMFFIITNMISKNIVDKDYNYKMLSEVSNLKLEDFNDVSKEDLVYFKVEKSPIASYLFYIDEGEKVYLRYEVFESEYKWAVKYNFDKTIKYLSKLGAKYIEKETKLPNDIKVYMNEKGYEYIIISENKMLEISTIETISEDELINIVYKKVFK